MIQNAAQELQLLDQVEDDRYRLEPNDEILLIIEDDVRFAKLLLEMVNKAGIKGLITGRGETAIMLTNLYKLQAIILNIELHDTNGIEVLRRLKSDPNIYHIPVHVITVGDQKEKSVRLVASSFLNKPVSEASFDKLINEIKQQCAYVLHNALIVESDASDRKKSSVYSKRII